MSRILPVAVLGALVALAAAGFTMASDPAYLQSDSAQYISTARSLLAGHGPATSVVWTAEHHRVGGLPVAQTNVPPGYPVLVAAVAAFGVEAPRAALGVTVFAFCAVPLLVYWLLRADAHTPAPSLALAAAWFAIPFVWFNVLARLSEMTYTLVTLLTLVCLRQRERHPAAWPAWLLAAGLCAGAAFTVRYAAVPFMAAVGVVLLGRALARRDARSLAAPVLVAVPAAALVLTIAVRNYGLTGRLAGGLLVDDGNSLAAVLHSVYWSLSDISGFSKADLVRGAPAEVLLVLLVAAALAWLASGARVRVQPTGAHAVWHDTAAAVSLLYVSSSLVFFIVAATRHVSGVVAPRYLIPLIPFVLLLVPHAARRLRVEASGRRRTAALALGWGAVAVFALGQLDVAVSHGAAPEWRTRARYIERALQQRVGTVTLREFLGARVSRDAPLLGNEAQLMAALLERPTVGLPGASYTRTVWTEDETRRTVARYGIAWVLFFPELLDATEPEAANQPFFVNLKQGRVPSWLAPTFQSNGVRLFQVTERGA